MPFEQVCSAATPVMQAESDMDNTAAVPTVAISSAATPIMQAESDMDNTAAVPTVAIDGATRGTDAVRSLQAGYIQCGIYRTNSIVA